jgi:hypothetical protein
VLWTGGRHFEKKASHAFVESTAVIAGVSASIEAFESFSYSNILREQEDSRQLRLQDNSFVSTLP